MDERVDRTGFDERTPAISRPVVARRPRRRSLLFGVLALVVVGLGLAIGHWRAPQRRRIPVSPPQPVGAATIDTGPIRVILDELGTVTPLDTVTVKTQINGQLIDVAFQEGQIVRKGDLLAQIDDRTFRAQLQRDQGQLAHDQGLLAQAQADLQRYITLGRQDSIAQQQVQDQRYLVQQDEGTVKADQGTVATDQINIAYCRIVSPVDGRVGLRQVDPGNYVQTSDANGIVVLTQIEPISVVFSVPQQDLAEVDQRMVQGATLPVGAYDQSDTTQLDAGRLATIDNEMDVATGTVKMRAVFPNGKNQLFPNQFVNAHLLVDTLANVVRVPVAAVQVGSPGSFVWVINGNGTVKSQTVKLGPVDGAYQQVISGLQAGERVVTDGADRLRDGAKVTIPSPGSPGQATTGETPPRRRYRGRRNTGQGNTGQGDASPGNASPGNAGPAAAGQGNAGAGGE